MSKTITEIVEFIVAKNTESICVSCEHCTNKEVVAVVVGPGLKTKPNIRK